MRVHMADLCSEPREDTAAPTWSLKVSDAVTVFLENCAPKTPRPVISRTELS